MTSSLPLFLPNIPKETSRIEFSEYYYVIDKNEPTSSLLTLLSISREKTNELLLSNPSTGMNVDPEKLVNEYLGVLLGFVSSPPKPEENKEGGASENNEKGEGVELAPLPSKKAEDSIKLEEIPLANGCLFTWSDFSRNSKPRNHGGVEFDAYSTILNLGLWYLQFAREQVSITPEERLDSAQKTAFQYYIKAAGVFQFLIDRNLSIEDYPLSDFRPGVLKALLNLSLAEAQTITIHRNENEQSPHLISSLCRDTADKYTLARDHLTSLETSLEPDYDKKWLVYLEFKSALYTAKAYYSLGCHLSNPDDPHAGKAIRAFETSTSTFDNARYFFINFLDLPPKTKGSESIVYFDSIRKKFEESLAKMRRENEVVYFDSIPEENEPLPDAKSTASPVPYVLPELNTQYWTELTYQTLRAVEDLVKNSKKMNPIKEKTTSCFTRKVPQKKTVIVIGGGVAGLTAAQELLEKGYIVKIYESQEVFGGKASAVVHNEVLLNDNSMKVFSASDKCLLDTLKTIPYLEGPAETTRNKRKTRTVFDNLLPADLDIVLPDGNKIKYNTSMKGSNRSHVTQFEKFKTELHDKSIPYQPNDFTKKHLRLAWLCELRKRKQLGNMSYEDYLQFEYKKDPNTKVLVDLVQTINQTPVDGNALSAADTALKTFGRYANPHKLQSITNVLNGSIQDKFIEPWVKHIQRLGGEVNTNKTLKKIIVDDSDKNLICGLQLSDGAIIQADLYVLALPYSKLKFVVEESRLNDRFKNLPSFVSTEGEKWVASCQFALRDLPSNMVPGVFNAVLDSPWGIMYYYVTSKVWEYQSYPSESAPIILYVTCSNAENLGKLHKKPFTGCTEQEFKEEILHQINFKEEEKHMLVDSVVGKGLTWWNTKQWVKDSGKSKEFKETKETKEEESEEGASEKPKKVEEEMDRILEKDVQNANELTNAIVNAIENNLVLDKKKDGSEEKTEEEISASPFSEYLKTSQSLATSPPINGERRIKIDEGHDIVLNDTLYYKTASMKELTPKTEFTNLFIAGECIRTRQTRSSMDKANEGGKRCAYAICKRDKVSYPRKKFEYHPLPYRGLRAFDAMKFSMFG